MKSIKRNSVGLTLLIVGFIVATLGITYSIILAFNGVQGVENSSLIMGDIYMYYNENNQLTLENAMPGDGFKTLVTGYNVNPIMAEQDASDITTELYACINLFQNDWGWGLDEGEDFESFCKGTGTSEGWTFQMGLDNGFFDEELLSLNIIQEETIEYTNIKLNPEMKNQTAEYENELTACVNLFQYTPIDEDSTVETFCQGTGTYDGGVYFQEDIDYWVDNNSIYYEYLSSNNIIIEDGDSYIINPDMANQTVGEINELMTCVSLVTDFGYEFDEGTTAESFCKGEGTYDGGITLKKDFEYAKDYIDYMTYIGNDLLENNIILTEIEDDLPYFEFTISGKNTYSERDIYYEIILSHGDNHETRTERIRDDLLRFRLVEIKDNQEKIVFSNVGYDYLTNKKIFESKISKDTMDEIDITYRLYMWISDDTVIGGGDATYDYDMDTWNNQVYGSIKVNITGGFQVYLKDALETEISNSSCNPIVEDEDGTIYFSGDNNCLNFNYVWYSGKLWRITAINPDGTMKMITDGLITTIAYGENNKFYADEENTSYVYQWLNQEFLPTLYNYKEIIVQDTVWNASPGNGVVGSKLPIEGQESIFVNSDVGLLNSYEYYMSYRNLGTNANAYSSGYLNIGNIWYLLNPYQADNTINGEVGNYGGYDSRNSKSSSGIRPSINLKSNILLESGIGTKSNPYILKGDQKSPQSNSTLLNTRPSGEYVYFDNEVYRIVGIENKTTKLVKLDYLTDETDAILDKRFASSKIFGLESNTHTEEFFDYYLNNTWKKAINDSYENMLVEGVYYLGKYAYGYHYKKTICKTFNSNTTINECIKNQNTISDIWTGFVGLPRVGEMFASQINSNRRSFWLISPETCIYPDNFLVTTSSYSQYSARPTIHLNSKIVIKSGLGTEQEPYVVGFPSQG